MRSLAGAQLWPTLVERAMDEPETISEMYRLLDPILRKLARQASWRLVDDMLQAAHVAIWQVLPRVDLSRGWAIRAMLIRTGYYAMRDELRRELRHRRVPLEPLEDALLQHHDRRRERFGGILDVYLEYVRENGTFNGAHQHMARRLGISTAKATSDFHRAAREYVQREDLCPPRAPYANIIEMVLAETAEIAQAVAGA